MRLASGPIPTRSQRASLRQRGAAFVVAAAVQVLLIAMLFGLAPSPMELLRSGKPMTFQLLPEPRTPAAHRHAATRPRRETGGAPRRSPTPPVKPAEKKPAPPLALIPLTSAEFAASDIAALPSHKSETGAGTGTSGPDAGSGASAAAGGGVPGPDRLFNAEWYREPTHAELAYYLPRTGVSGWGEIACRTIPNFQVDDCRELGDSPMGSGLARAVRQAAWQFRVRPPRVNGRSLVGSWVRIRIDYVEGLGAPR